jgi:RNA polymerase sigma-70 factor (ECF subfamily)
MTSKVQSPPLPPDEEVIRRFRETGDNAYFAELFAMYRKKVYFACRAFHSDGGAAEDATQETFLRAYQRMHQFTGGDFCAWLMRIARNICIDQYRKRPLEAEGEVLESADRPLWHAVQALPDEQLAAKSVLQGMACLPAEQRQCLEMRVEGYSYEETAAKTGLSMEAVKSHLQNGRRMLWLRMEKTRVRST